MCEYAVVRVCLSVLLLPTKSKLDLDGNLRRTLCLFLGVTFTHIHCFPVLPVVPSITVAVLPIKRTVSLKLASLLLLHIAVSAIIAVVSSYILRCLFSCLTVNLGRIFSKNAWHVNSFIC